MNPDNFFLLLLMERDLGEEYKEDEKGRKCRRGVSATKALGTALAMGEPFWRSSEGEPRPNSIRLGTGEQVPRPTGGQGKQARAKSKGRNEITNVPIEPVRRRYVCADESEAVQRGSRREQGKKEAARDGALEQTSTHFLSKHARPRVVAAAAESEAAVEVEAAHICMLRVGVRRERNHTR